MIADGKVLLGTSTASALGKNFIVSLDALTGEAYLGQDLGLVLAYTGGGWPEIDDVSISVVPEPATMSLLALGGMAMLRRKKK